MTERKHAKDLTAEERRLIQLGASPARRPRRAARNRKRPPRGGGGTTGPWSLNCHACGEQIQGATAMDRHRDEHRHHRFDAIM